MGMDLARLMQLIPGDENKAARSAMVTGGVLNQVRHANAGALALASSVSPLLSTRCPHAPLMYLCCCPLSFLSFIHSILGLSVHSWA